MLEDLARLHDAHDAGLQEQLAVLVHRRVRLLHLGLRLPALHRRRHLELGALVGVRQVQRERAGVREVFTAALRRK